MWFNWCWIWYSNIHRWLNYQKRIRKKLWAAKLWKQPKFWKGLRFFNSFVTRESIVTARISIEIISVFCIYYKIVENKNHTKIYDMTQFDIKNHESVIWRPINCFHKLQKGYVKKNQKSPRNNRDIQKSKSKIKRKSISNDLGK